MFTNMRVFRAEALERRNKRQQLESLNTVSSRYGRMIVASIVVIAILGVYVLFFFPIERKLQAEGWIWETTVNDFARADFASRVYEVHVDEWDEIEKWSPIVTLVATKSDVELYTNHPEGLRRTYTGNKYIPQESVNPLPREGFEEAEDELVLTQLTSPLEGQVRNPIPTVGQSLEPGQPITWIRKFRGGFRIRIPLETPDYDAVNEDQPIQALVEDIHGAEVHLKGRVQRKLEEDNLSDAPYWAWRVLTGKSEYKYAVDVGGKIPEDVDITDISTVDVVFRIKQNGLVDRIE